MRGILAARGAVVFLIFSALIGFPGAGCGRSAPAACIDDSQCPAASHCSPFLECLAAGTICGSDRDCGIKLKCLQFQCVRTNACTDDLGCLSGTTCVISAGEVMGLCMDSGSCSPPCSAGSYCSASRICVGEDQCAADADCAVEQVCTFGSCVTRSRPQVESAAETECSWDQDCAMNEHCEGSRCKESVCGPCPRTHRCIAGRCSQIGCSEETACIDGYVCIEGRCLFIDP